MTQSTRAPTSGGARGWVRPFRRGDIPAVVALRQQLFRISQQPSTEALAAAFERVFFDHPWVDAELPSLVYEGPSGRVVGFLGVIPRRMLFQGSPIRVAVTTQFMVSRGSGPVPATLLLRAALSGPQDLTMADAANAVARRVMEGLGARTSLAHSFSWLRPLRPWRFRTAQLAANAPLRVAMFALRPACAALDALAARGRRSSLRMAAPAGSTGPLTASTMVRHLDEVLAEYPLRPVYEDGSLDWLLARVAEKGRWGELEGALVRDAAGIAAGWFLVFPNPKGVAQVVQLAAVKRSIGLVLEHLFHHARRRGAIAVSGRLHPWCAAALAEHGCRFALGGVWTLVHSRRPELLCAIDQGEAFLSRLEGEWWLPL